MQLKLKKSQINPQLRRVRGRFNKVPKEAHKFFVKTTPIDTGNARRRTRLQGTTIKANYPYVKPLDDGHSRQAPGGMVKPTIEFVKKLVKKMTGGR